MRGHGIEGRGRMRLGVWLPLLLVACSEPPAPPAQVPGAAAVADFASGGDWGSYNRDLAGTRHSPLREINPTNVDELRQAWSYALGGPGGVGGSEFTPLVVAGVLYAAAADRVVALHAHSGEELWRHTLVRGSPSRRGLGFWRGHAAVGSRIFVTAGRVLLALDAATGERVASFGVAGEVELPVGYNAAPTVFEDLVIVGSQSAPGGLHAFDARSGAPVWTFAADDDLWLPAFAFAIDVDRALLYAPVVAPKADPHYGGNRESAETLANAVVALDVRTGERRWHFQTVRHDLWDYDLRAAPTLLDATIAGERMPLLAQLARTGYLYVLNRVTGVPVFGVADVPVPVSNVPGERSAPTQPIPVKPPPLARVSFVADDLVTQADTTPAHAAACRELRDRAGVRNLGPFTPYGFKAPGATALATAVFPGAIGGAGVGGLAADPRAGVVFINTTSAGDLGWLEPNDADSTAAQTGTLRARLPYRLVGALGRADTRFAASDAPLDAIAAAAGADVWPCQKPPWGELAAVAVASGEVLWRVPLGITEQLPEASRRTGRPNVGGAITTAAGLVFIGASNDRRFRAFESRTGRELWTTELPRSAHAVPITYLGADGKQYVAIVAAGALSIDDSGAADAESLIAYALP